MAEKKIPVLTEVYKPKKSAEASKSAGGSLEATPELLATVSAQIKPILEAEIKDLILGEVRDEMKKLREDVLLATQNLVDETAAKVDSPSDDTAEQAAKVISQVKPRLETEITDFALDELRVEIKKARGEVVASTEDFVDKAKADLQTEMPKMYQKSIDLAQVDLTEKIDASLLSVTEATAQLEAHQGQLVDQHQSKLSESFNSLHTKLGEDVQSALRDELTKVQESAIQSHQTQLNEALDGFLQIRGEEAEQSLMQKMQDYQEKIRVHYQEQLTEQMTNAMEAIKQRVEESTEEQIGVMHSQVGTIQQETFAKLREDFSAEKSILLSDSLTDIRATLTKEMGMRSQELSLKSQEISEQFLSNIDGSLPEVQQVLQENIQAMLNDAIAELETRLRGELTEEIWQLLLKVKFVLPENS